MKKVLVKKNGLSCINLTLQCNDHRNLLVPKPFNSITCNEASQSYSIELMKRTFTFRLFVYIAHFLHQSSCLGESDAVQFLNHFNSAYWKCKLFLSSQGITNLYCKVFCNWNQHFLVLKGSLSKQLLYTFVYQYMASLVYCGLITLFQNNLVIRLVKRFCIFTLH